MRPGDLDQAPPSSDDARRALRLKLVRAINKARVAMGMRRLPEWAPDDFARREVLPEQVADSPEGMRRLVRYSVAVAVFAAAALLIVWIYAAATNRQGPANVAAADALLRQAVTQLRKGEGDEARAIQEKLETTPGTGLAAGVLAGYMAAEEGVSEAEMEQRFPVGARGRKALTALLAHAGYREWQGDLPQALEKLDEAIEAAPDEEMLHSFRGQLLLALGRPTEAIAEADVLEEMLGPNGQSLMQRGRAYLALRQPKLAAQELRAAMLYGIAPPGASLALTDAYILDGDLNRARAEAERLVTRHPDMAEAHTRMGVVLDQLGELPLARESYERAVKLDPEQHQALNNLAYLLAKELGSPGEALTYAKRAREASPEDPSVADTLGYIYQLLGRQDEALVELEFAAKGLPGNAEVQKHLEATRKALGQGAPVGQ